MRLLALRVRDLRCFAAAELAPAPGFNLILGPNGSGKTTLLEAVHLLSHARSFRAGSHAALTAEGAAGYAVFAEVAQAEDVRQRLGMARDGDGWELRVNGERAANLGEILGRFASVCFEPGTHALIAGGARIRRRFLDWSVFHVEHDFLDAWQRYARALRQRNLLLRQGGSDAELAAWEAQMAAAGERLDASRRACAEALEPRIKAESEQLIPSLGAPRLQYSPGWAGGQALAEALAAARPADRRRGHTGVGPHRADWRLQFPRVAEHDRFSRGQEKLAALACVLGQAAHLAGESGEWPVVCLDDLAAELDPEHQSRLVERLLASTAQVLVTGTSVPQALAGREVAMFHVEHDHSLRGA